MLVNVLKKIKSLALKKKNLFEACSKLNKFSIIDSNVYSDLVIRGYKPLDEEEVSKIYIQLNGIGFSKYHRDLYKLAGDKILLLAADMKTNKIVGMDMFYFNSRDFKENTIHEGFIGVLPEFEGQGIATKMRQEAINHFRRNGLSGISTRISKNNLGSLRSAEKLGFKPVEQYYDEQMQEERYYMINWFKN